MDEYLNRGELLREMRREYRKCAADGEECGGESVLLAEGIESTIDTVKHFPVADVVPVVRCKNCKHLHHWQSKQNKEHHFWCYRLVRSDREFRVKPNDFCSYGKRKDVEDG